MMKLATGLLLATALLVACWVEFGVAKPQSVKANIHVSVGGDSKKGQCGIGQCLIGSDCGFEPYACCCEGLHCKQIDPLNPNLGHCIELDQKDPKDQ